ncbi:MAG: hypothetical protein KY445_01770 [Armatimonadetes bacterium]|nr:hypothetical protein [Armatimonadota bacterium]
MSHHLPRTALNYFLMQEMNEERERLREEGKPIPTGRSLGKRRGLRPLPIGSMFLDWKRAQAPPGILSQS